MKKISLHSVAFFFVGAIFLILLITVLPSFSLKAYALAVLMLLCGFVFVKHIDIFLNRYIPVILIVVYFCLLMAAAFALKVEPAWDFGRVYAGAQDITTNGRLTYALQYFLESNNNFFLAGILAVYFLAASAVLGLPALSAGLILNVVAITTGVVLIYFTTKTVRSAKAGLLFLVLAILFVPLYGYSAIFYTDTLSIPFVAAAIFLISKIIKRPSTGMYIALAAVAFVGYKIKPTVILLVIALFASILLFKKIKEHYKGMLVFCAVFLGFSLTYNFWLHNNDIIDMTDIESHRLPFSHYVLMGLQGNGGYNEELHINAAGLSSADEIDQYSFEEIANTFRTRSFLEIIGQYANKIRYTWADGNYFASQKLAIDPINEGFLHTIVLNGASLYPIYDTITAAAQILIVLSIAAHGVLISRKNMFESVLGISVALLFLFLLVWETRSRYLINYTLVFLCMQSSVYINLFEKISEKIENKFPKKQKTKSENTE